MKVKEKGTNILIVDDRGDALSRGAPKNLSKRATVTVLHPQDVELEDLLHANLVLVDYQLDNWRERGEASALALRPQDGLALANLLRRHVQINQDKPVAFAIFTGHIENLARPLPAEYRLHVVARFNNLEWVFRKERVNFDQLVELALSVKRLPVQWPTNPKKALGQLSELLDLEEDDSDLDLILDDVESCQPPIHELSKYSHGLAILRWLLHRILPYPCFLWTTRQVAARLRVDYEWLREQLRRSGALSRELEKCQYAGILSTFLGKRWWRVKVERFLWKITEGKSSDVNAMKIALQKLVSHSLHKSEPVDYPIICFGSKYRPLKAFYAMEDAVRIRPDDWPPYADQAWTTIALANKYPHLKALVIREDRDKLDR